MTAPALPPHRALCVRCRRPEGVCYCRHIIPLETATRVLLLQHPRERDVAIGTARMASLCLPNSELHVGVHWGESAAVARALADPLRPAALLYPGPSAQDLAQTPPRGPITLVVVDGTWWQAKKIVRENPALAALPRYSFTPAAPSEYRIRREPRQDYVSTIEALAHVLGALEGDPERFRQLLAPFHAMVDAQLHCVATLRAGRVRHPRRPKEGRARGLPRGLAGRAAHLVCIAAEANAWPYHSGERRAAYPDELVHFTACRVASGESLDVVLAPRHPLSPRTPAQIGLSERELAGGCSVAELLRSWRAFSRGTDLVCSWGSYASRLFEAVGGALPEDRLDLRQVARTFASGHVGTVEEFCERFVGPSDDPPPDARARARLARLSAIARRLSELAG